MTIYERLDKIPLDKFNKTDLLELLTSSIKTLSEKEALLLSDNPNLFWFEFVSGDETASGNNNIFIELQYKGNRYKATFQIAN